MWSILCLVFFSAGFFASLFRWTKRRRTTALINRIPGTRLHFFNLLGHMDRVFTGKFKKRAFIFEVYYFLYLWGYSYIFGKESLIHFWQSYKPSVILLKASAVETLLSQNTELEKGWIYSFLHPWLETGLLTSSGSKWKQRRKLLTPAFHFNILKDFVPVFNNQSKILIDILTEQKDKDWIDIVPLITRCSLDIICDSILGVQVHAQTKIHSEYVKAVLSLSEEIFMRLESPWLWPDFLFRMSSSGKRFNRNVEIVHRFTNQVIAKRKEQFKSKTFQSSETNSSTNKRRALLHLLLDEHMSNGSLKEEDIREEVDTFTFEGHDTTATGMSWALYLIGLYPEIQSKIHSELYSIFMDDTERSITVDDLRDMKYLECVLKESQRLYPSVPFFSRDLKNDIVIDGFTVPKGTMCGVFTFVLHRDRDIYPNPEKFDPHRFLSENCKGRHPFAYVPFSAGSRNCIGQRFAMMEEKTVVANVLRHFRIRSLDQRDKVQFMANMVLRPVYGLRIHFERRINHTNSGMDSERI